MFERKLEHHLLSKRCEKSLGRFSRVSSSMALMKGVEYSVIGFIHCSKQFVSIL